MRFRPVITLLCLWAVAACAAAKVPDWVKKRPVADSCYIGIGTAPASAPDCEQTAREKALADLIAQIQVTVENESLLQRIDENGNYYERYTDDIRTRSKAWLEGYDLVGTYNDGQTCRVYYRIGKERYAELKRAKAREASLTALDCWTNGNKALEGGDFTAAASMYAAGIKAIEPFSDMRLIVEADQTMNIAMELQMSLARMFGEFEMQSTPSALTVKPFAGTPADVLILSKSGINGLSNVPLEASIDNRKAAVTAGSTTDQSGHARISISGITEKGGPWTITVTPALDVSHLFDTPALEAIYASLAGKIRPIRIRVDVADAGLKAVCRPADAASEELDRMVGAFISKNYFDLVDSPDEADIAITVSASFAKGGTVKADLNDITRYVCNATVTVTDLRKQAGVITVNAAGDAGLRSGQSESKAFKTASNNAMKKLRKELESQFRSRSFTPRVRRQGDDGMVTGQSDFFDDEYK